MWFCSAQYATPVLQNSIEKIALLDYPSIIERLLKLSTISLIIWLAGFFALFQSFLNALAEVTRFADREFYEAWCNPPPLPPLPKSHSPPSPTNILHSDREQRRPRCLLAHLEQARISVLPPPRLFPNALPWMVAQDGLSHCLHRLRPSPRDSCRSSNP